MINWTNLHPHWSQSHTVPIRIDTHTTTFVEFGRYQSSSVRSYMRHSQISIGIRNVAMSSITDMGNDNVYFRIHTYYRNSAVPKIRTIPTSLVNIYSAHCRMWCNRPFWYRVIDSTRKNHAPHGQFQISSKSNSMSCVPLYIIYAYMYGDICEFEAWKGIRVSEKLNT